MGSPTLDPRSLTEEERARVDFMAAAFYIRDSHLSIEQCYKAALDGFADLDTYSRALFAPPESEPEKVECNPNSHVWRWGECLTCQPVPAAAVEMPEAVTSVLQYLRFTSGLVANDRADALESWWRSQPVARVEMTEAASVGKWQLEDLLKYANLAEVSLRTGFAPPDFLGVDLPYLLRRAIAAVRAQATAPRGKMEKVRSFLNLMALYYKNDDTDLPQKVRTQGSAWAEALAELDAFEVGREGEGK